MLSALIDEARRLGVTQVVLETGTRQPEAMGLYEGAGLERIAPFREYVDSPLSVCWADSFASTTGGSTRTGSPVAKDR